MPKIFLHQSVYNLKVIKKKRPFKKQRKVFNQLSFLLKLDNDILILSNCKSLLSIACQSIEMSKLFPVLDNSTDILSNLKFYE